MQSSTHRGNKNDILSLHIFHVPGFGPFGEHKVNASWSAVQELQRLGLEDDDVELVISEIAVEYEMAAKIVPQLWKDYDPCVR